MKHLFTLAAVLLTSVAFSQTSSSSAVNEVGFTFSSLNNFGLTYRTGTQQAVWRFTTLASSVGSTEQDAPTQTLSTDAFSFDLAAGRELRRPITEKFEFRFGGDLGLRFSRFETETDDKVGNLDTSSEENLVTPRFNLVLGFNYVFASKIVMGAEILPQVSYTTGTRKERSPNLNNGAERETDISNFQFLLTNSSVLHSIAYRF